MRMTATRPSVKPIRFFIFISYHFAHRPSFHKRRVTGFDPKGSRLVLPMGLFIFPIVLHNTGESRAA